MFAAPNTLTAAQPQDAQPTPSEFSANVHFGTRTNTNSPVYSRVSSLQLLSKSIKVNTAVTLKRGCYATSAHTIWKDLLYSLTI